MAFPFQNREFQSKGLAKRMSWKKTWFWCTRGTDVMAMLIQPLRNSAGTSTLGKWEGLGKCQKAEKWVQNEPLRKNQKLQVNYYTSLYSSFKRFFFFWTDIRNILYCNIKERYQWLRHGERLPQQQRARMHPRKNILRDIQGLIYYKLLYDNHTITVKVYCQRLRYLKQLWTE